MQYDYDPTSSKSRPINIPGTVPREHKRHVSQYNDQVILSSTRIRRDSHGASSTQYSPDSSSKHTQKYNDHYNSANMSFVVPVPQSFMGATQLPRGSRHTDTPVATTSHTGYTISCSYCRNAIPELGMRAHLKTCPALSSDNTHHHRSPHPTTVFPRVSSAPSSHSSSSYYPLTPPSPQWNDGFYSPGHAHPSLDAHGWLPSPSHTTAATSPSQSRHIALPEVPEDSDGDHAGYIHPSSDTGARSRFMTRHIDRPAPLDKRRKYHSDYPAGMAGKSHLNGAAAFPSYAADGSRGYGHEYGSDYGANGVPPRAAQSLDDQGFGYQQQAYLSRGRPRHRRSSVSSHPGFDA